MKEVDRKKERKKEVDRKKERKRSIERKKDVERKKERKKSIERKKERKKESKKERERQIDRRRERRTRKKHKLALNTVCGFYAFTASMTGFVDIATMALISCERYRVICYPLKPTKHLSKRIVQILMVLTWAYALLWCVPPFLGWNQYVPEGA